MADQAKREADQAKYGTVEARPEAEHQELVVKQYEAVKAIAQARLDLASIRVQLAKAGFSRLIVADW